MAELKNPRAVAATSLQQVLQHGHSLSAAFPHFSQSLSPADRALAQAICYGVLRHLPEYEWLISQLIDKPLKKKVRIVHYVLLAGLYQLREMRVATHAAINETVQAAVQLKQRPLKGLVNAVLRNYQRQHAQLEHQLKQKTELSGNFPGWLQRRIETSWPEQALSIIKASNANAPMWLRVNESKISTKDYCKLLDDAGIPAQMHADLTESKENTVSSAIRLGSPTDVHKLPGFDDGWVSVQDLSAQRAAKLLQVKPEMRVLDACAAPGGKSAHILELTPEAELVALDHDESRIERIHQNLQRLKLSAKVVHGDAADPNTWWDEQQFDRILIDAPCSATGVIRRHPDIKWLRRDSDIATLSALQADILNALWELLKPGGRLIYATCSILPEENELQIQQFIAKQDDANLVSLREAGTLGWQIFPDPELGDGFYYACIEKH